LNPKCSDQIREEVQKQIECGFIKSVIFSEWVANIVLVDKKDGKVRMCVDFRDLNKAIPKDNFSLPHIDLIVDGSEGFAMISINDCYSGYNQVPVDEEDMEKTTFIGEWGTFYYKIMPFRLKNAGGLSKGL